MRTLNKFKFGVSWKAIGLVAILTICLSPILGTLLVIMIMKKVITYPFIFINYILTILKFSKDMTPQNYELLNRLVSRDGQFGDLSEQGFDVAKIISVANKGEFGFDDKLTMMGDVLKLVAGSSKHGKYIQSSDMFPITSLGSSRLVAIVLALIPIHKRPAYLASISAIDIADGVAGDELSSEEIQQVIQISVSELSSLIPSKHGKFIPILQGIISFILPFIFKRK